ncbi:MAG: NAD(P)/FAD-dependent oxidoreductase [Halioglobus sp.]
MEQLSKHYDVIVLGAGAAGLMCAFTAAQRGQRVLVLEKANKVGKKILMSGGGRCNFTNLYVEADNFLSANPHFCKAALSRYTQWDFIAMVEAHNIGYEERKHGQLFCTKSAKDILNMLLQECHAAGATILTHCDITSVARTDPEPVGTGKPGRFSLQMKRNDQLVQLAADSVVVATGALSIPSLGGSDMGYQLATQFALPLIDRSAGLVPFMFSDATGELCKTLSGVSLPVEVSCGGVAFTESLLFTHRGVSGPAILQISSYWKPGDYILLNLLPQLQCVDWLLATKAQEGRIQLKTLLSRELPKALVSELQRLWWPESGQLPLAQFSDGQLTAIALKLNNWQLKPSTTEGYRTAEVTLGGVDTDSVSSKTMEVKSQSGLYFIGEVLDVTGHLGGFNFQWAWSSGYTAGLFV